MVLDYKLAKKFPTVNTKGLELRRLTTDRAVVFNSAGEGYDKLKELKDSMFGHGVKLKGTGKSLEITGAGMVDFLAELIFTNDSQNDLVRFLKNESSKLGEITGIEADGKAAIIYVRAEAEDADVFYGELLPILADYDIGILY
ncbi:MAG: hypothetical protein IKX81_05710 [Firmicutes bacterium]|nr:hypothetical protein [Bacillota bacterium]